MPVKTTITESDFPKILSNYDLGEYHSFQTFAHGAGQTTALLETNKGKFVLRYYENRSKKHVLFEVQLFNYLHSKNYPVPTIIKNHSGNFSHEYKNKPYIILEFIGGEHSKNPNDFFDDNQVSEVVKAIAQLHNLTLHYKPKYFKDREPFDVAYCWKEFQKKHSKIVKSEKGKWLKNELKQLEFPTSLPKGLCHADLNYGNFLFKNEKITAVLDFDMSFYTYFIYDIASLIYWWTWPPQKGFKEKETAQIITEYSKWRKLTIEEKNHVYDAIKLIILLGISWSGEEDFESEKTKIEFLNSIGRQQFYNKIFL